MSIHMNPQKSIPDFLQPFLCIISYTNCLFATRLDFLKIIWL